MHPSCAGKKVSDMARATLRLKALADSELNNSFYKISY